MVGAREDEVRHQLLAAFSHDLRAPLARLIQASRAPAYGDEAQYRATVAACARQQLSLLDDLLDYTRYALTPPEVVPAPAYLYALVDEAGRGGRALAADGVAQIVVAVAPDLPPLVMLDAKLLRQVLRKLLACAQAPVVLAFDAGPVSPQGRLSLRCSVGAAACGEQAVGTSFSATAAVLAAGSTAALDLAIADQLLRAMGSRLQLEAAGDAGKLVPRYFFELETVIAAEADAMLPLQVFSGEATMAGLARRILVVDMAPAMLDYLCEVLEHGGFEVDRADSAHEALALHGAQPFALLVCGHQPPVLDAWDLLRQLGVSPMAPPVLLHALTPLPRPDGFPAALDFAAVMYRPAAPDRLLMVLAGLSGI